MSGRVWPCRKKAQNRKMLCSQRALVKTNRSNDWPSLKPIIKSSFGPRDEGHTRARLQHPKDGVDLIGAIFRPFTAALKQTNRSLEKISIFQTKTREASGGRVRFHAAHFPVCCCCFLLYFLVLPTGPPSSPILCFYSAVNGDRRNCSRWR